LALFALGLCALAMPASAQPGLPQNIYVDDDAAPGGNGNSWATAYNDLHLALDRVRANPDTDGNIIRMAAGVYRPYEFGQPARIYAVPSDTTILGGFLPEFGNPRDPVNTPTIITGDIKGDDTAEGGNRTDNAQLLIAPAQVTGNTLVATSDVVFDGLTIERAGYDQAVPFGSGVRTTIRNCVVRFNYSPSSFAKDTVLEDTLFIDNFASAIYVNASNAQGRPTGGAFTMSRCVFLRNGRFLDADSLGNGGMILYLKGTDLHAIDCEFGEHPFGTVPGSAAFYFDDFRPLSGPYTFAHTFEGCTFTGIAPPLINQRQDFGTVQSIVFRQCTVGSLPQGLGFLRTIDATGTTFTAVKSITPRYPSHFVDCDFDTIDAFTIVSSSGSNPRFPETLLDGCSIHSWKTQQSSGAAIAQDCTFTGLGRILLFNSVTMERCIAAMKYSAAVGSTGTVSLIAADSTLRLTNCDFIGCDTGTASIANGPMRVDSCRFERNTCGAVLAGNAIVVNSLFADNNSGTMRDLIAGNMATIVNSTFVNNGDPIRTTASNFFLKNCILWGNRNGTSQSIQTQQLGGNTSLGGIDSCLIEGWTGTYTGVDCFGADPEFLDPLGPDGSAGTGDEDYRLSVFSPAIDAGNAALLPADAADLDGDGNTTEPVPFDLDGNARIVASPMHSGADPALALDIGAYEFQADCNENGVFDLDDIDGGASADCNENLIPDDCEPDCDGDGILDVCEIALGLDIDCNTNDLPDSCDIASGASLDCNENGIPDECEPDCNGNGIPDECDIDMFATSEDCNDDGFPDECRAEVQYTVDDGIAYANRNLSLTFIFSGSSTPPVIPTILLTQHTVEPGGEFIHEVEFFGGSREEVSVFLVIYDDPDNDGDTNDATLIAAYPVEQPWVSYTGDAAYRTQSFPATYVGDPGDSFFVGLWFTYTSYQGADLKWYNSFAGFVRSACHSERCFLEYGVDRDSLGFLGDDSVHSLRWYETVPYTPPFWHCSRPPTSSGGAISMHFRPRTLRAYDCDLNASPDICGPFPDINTNGVPDDCECPGDVNGDGKVNVKDFTTLAQSFGKTGAFWFDGDLTGDHAVNTADFAVLAATFGQFCRVPPPASGRSFGSADPLPMPIQPIR